MLSYETHNIHIVVPLSLRLLFLLMARVLCIPLTLSRSKTWEFKPVTNKSFGIATPLIYAFVIQNCNIFLDNFEGIAKISCENATLNLPRLGIFPLLLNLFLLWFNQFIYFNGLLRRQHFMLFSHLKTLKYHFYCHYIIQHLTNQVIETFLCNSLDYDENCIANVFMNNSVTKGRTQISIQWIQVKLCCLALV